MRRARQNFSITLGKHPKRASLHHIAEINVSSERHLFIGFGNKALEAPHAGRVSAYRHHRFDFFL